MKNILNFSQLDRLEDTEAEGSIWPMSVDDRAVDALISKESGEIHSVDSYAPDTLDIVEGILRLSTHFVLSRLPWDCLCSLFFPFRQYNIEKSISFLVPDILLCR